MMKCCIDQLPGECFAMLAENQVDVALGDRELISDLLMGESLRTKVDNLFRDVLLRAVDGETCESTDQDSFMRVEASLFSCG